MVGVFAPGLTDRGQGEFALPLAFTPVQLNHDSRWLDVMGRLKPGVSIKQAQADMEAVTTRLAATYPSTDKGWGASVEPLKNDFIPSDRIMTLWLLLGAVAFVLLIACANVANLMLSKSVSRQSEMALRSALGAKSSAIFSQLLTESLLLAIGGGALGIGVGYAILRGLISVMPPDTLPSEADLSLNLPILLFSLAATTLAGVLFGCAPAWYASRVDPNEALKAGGRAAIGAGRHRLRCGLGEEQRVTPAMEQDFRRVLDQKSVIATLESQLRSRQQEMDGIAGDQRRVRENMKVLKGSPEERALVEPNTRQLDSQEDRLVSLRTELSDSRLKREQAGEKLDQILNEASLTETF